MKTGKNPKGKKIQGSGAKSGWSVEQNATLNSLAQALVAGENFAQQLASPTAETLQMFGLGDVSVSQFKAALKQSVAKLRAAAKKSKSPGKAPGLPPILCVGGPVSTPLCPYAPESCSFRACCPILCWASPKDTPPKPGGPKPPGPILCVGVPPQAPILCCPVIICSACATATRPSPGGAAPGQILCVSGAVSTPLNPTKPAGGLVPGCPPILCWACVAPAPQGAGKPAGKPKRGSRQSRK